MTKKVYLLIFLVCVVCLLALLVYSIPQVYERVSWHIDDFRTKIKYAVQPPEKVVFDPSKVTEVVKPTTPASVSESVTPTLASVIPTLEATPTLIPLATLTPTVSPLPASVDLKGVRYMDQHGLYNYCAPSNLAMLLSFWKWDGDRIDVGKAIKPYTKDKNVMPYEMADYVKEQTALNVVIRVGGDVDTVKRFLAAGFPVLIEKGTFIVDINKELSWMGHYNVITGYNDAEQVFTVQDSYFQPDLKIPYEKIVEDWRGFNFLYMVAFPSEQYSEVMNLLGADADEKTNYLNAADKASYEIVALNGADKFFAWFNRGESLAELQDYGGAAQCFDEAFKMYPVIPEEKRPWRVVWYRTGPYKAYFGVGRYQTVIDLATTTLDQMSEPYLEESYYWRARARWELGDQQGAIADFRKSLEYHPNFGPTMYQVELLEIDL